MIDPNYRWIRWLTTMVAVCLLVGVYLFQRLDLAYLLNPEMGANARFVINKTTRFLLNDLASLMLIVGIFNQIKYVRLGFMLFLLELFILLPLYFTIKLTLEGDNEISSPLLSQLHRMIVNPLLMIVLIIGLLYQDFGSGWAPKK